MKYRISINQKAVFDMGLQDKVDFIDLAIYDFITSFMLCEDCVKTNINGIQYFWIKPSLIIDEMPLLGINTTRGINNRINKLADCGLLERCPINQSLHQPYFKIGPKYKEYKFFAWNENSSLGTDFPSTWNENSDNNNNNIDYNINKEKENIKEREKQILPDYIAPEYIDVMTEWLEYKKERRESYKSRGLKQCYDKLVKFSNGNPATALEIIHSAMSNNYSGFFPLRNMAQSKLTPYEQQQLERQQYTAMFEQRIFDNISSIDDDEGEGCGRLPDDI